MGTQSSQLSSLNLLKPTHSTSLTHFSQLFLPSICHRSSVFYHYLPFLLLNSRISQLYHHSTIFLSFSTMFRLSAHKSLSSTINLPSFFQLPTIPYYHVLLLNSRISYHTLPCFASQLMDFSVLISFNLHSSISTILYHILLQLTNLSVPQSISHHTFISLPFSATISPLNSHIISVPPSIYHHISISLPSSTTILPLNSRIFSSSTVADGHVQTLSHVNFPPKNNLHHANRLYI